LTSLPATRKLLEASLFYNLQEEKTILFVTHKFLKAGDKQSIRSSLTI